MDRQVRVVTGANAGDEGKGLVARCLAERAVDEGRRVLTVLYNGGCQRGHTVGERVLHCVGAGDTVGGSTYYHPRFLLDPIALFLTGERVIVDPACRVVIPTDVVRNQEIEAGRGDARHGSCGMGIFECVKRSREKPLCAAQLWESPFLVRLIREIEPANLSCEHPVYNLNNFIRACGWVKQNCRLATLSDIIDEFDTLIYEGGQGLLLDQTNLGDFPHLTPSSVGGYNIASEIAVMGARPELYYVSRGYMTRHGAGPMEHECGKADINPDIVDRTNEANPWQGALRFGFLDTQTQFERIRRDLAHYADASARLVYTQLNYTGGKLATSPGTFTEIARPDFIDAVYGSTDKTSMSELKLDG